MDRTEYALIQKLLHWAVAVLVLASLIGGAFLWWFGFTGLRDTFGQEATNTIYTYHKTSGVLILGLMLARIAVRRAYGVPAPAATLTGLERMLSEAVHLGLYVAVTAMAVVGWLATGSGGFPVDFFNMRLPGILPKNEGLSETLFGLHALLGLAVLGLVALHVAGAMVHWRIKRDGVMARMSLFG